ncbi:hypothetical protein RI129_012005 [Pyrocoelia pectoralis]|uniref:MADF domain-containing protein n=1 Tax=Pyrocoelia pectoralis TaxID=417401 RepID=A0AAN7V5L5_9COLE
MDWSNEKAIEFLELFQMEPCLWVPTLKLYKNRGAQSDAWRRIAQGLSFPATIEELKKKKDSLMGYYRIHLNKYKKSLKFGAGISDIYTTNWFAFDMMNGFLKPIYEGNKTMNSENVGFEDDDDHDEDPTDSDSFCESGDEELPSKEAKTGPQRLKIANRLNDYIIESIEHLVAAPPPTATGTTEEIDDQMESESLQQFKPVKRELVSEVVSGIQNSASEGVISASSSLLKRAWEVIAEEVAQVVKLSLGSGKLGTE